MRKLVTALCLWAMISSAAFAQQTGFAPMTNGISVPSTSYASLSTDHLASSYPGVVFYVPDGPTGASLALSDGTSWKLFARGVIAQTYTLTASDAGLHTFSFSGITSMPNIQVSIVDNTTTGLLTYNLQGASTTGVTVRVNRGLLAALTGGTTTGVTINLLVVPNN